MLERFDRAVYEQHIHAISKLYEGIGLTIAPNIVPHAQTLETAIAELVSYSDAEKALELLRQLEEHYTYIQTVTEKGNVITRSERVLILESLRALESCFLGIKLGEKLQSHRDELTLSVFDRLPPLFSLIEIFENAGILVRERDFSLSSIYRPLEEATKKLPFPELYNLLKDLYAKLSDLIDDPESPYEKEDIEWSLLFVKNISLGAELGVKLPQKTRRDNT